MRIITAHRLHKTPTATSTLISTSNLVIDLLSSDKVNAFLLGPSSQSPVAGLAILLTHLLEPLPLEGA